MAIQGYDVLSYLEKRAEKGREEFSIEYGGIKWYFANSDHRDQFRQDPEVFPARVRRILRLFSWPWVSSNCRSPRLQRGRTQTLPVLRSGRANRVGAGPAPSRHLGRSILATVAPVKMPMKRRTFLSLTAVNGVAASSSLAGAVTIRRLRPSLSTDLRRSIRGRSLRSPKSYFPPKGWS